ncbi:Amino acid permease [Ceratobasidium theobromae]|uniref:Amino acid permease n=1 Tax=Ceratobasidium theobromae TaxID=1582974 RepID=A0A5N5QIC6_9AGAM|nr:Amino acid permease [Ceratobasidium theobromae]
MASNSVHTTSDLPHEKGDNLTRETDETLLHLETDDYSFGRKDWATSRTLFFLGLSASGPLALWTSSLVSLVFTSIIAAVLCEICSALPTSGSLYVWAAEAAGPKYGRFVAFITAWWATAAWMAFPAAGCQFAATYLLSIPSLYGLDFPGGISNDNIKWRALVWIVAEVLLLIGVGLSCVPHNGTGASAGWSWMLALFSIISTTVGFEASAHVAEETNNAKIVAARSVFASGVLITTCQFVEIILFLFCVPSHDVIATFDAPQPFVQLYGLALGRRGATFMAILSTVNFTLATVTNVMAPSRLVFAIARDGVLPFASWVQHITPDKRPRNAILLVYIYSALLLCSSLPSAVAFSSLISIGCVPLAATYGLIGLLRLTVSSGKFRRTKFPLGYFAKPFYFCSALYGGVMVAVLVSPLQFPVTGPNLNYTGPVFGIITIFGVLSWLLIPEEKWMRSERITEMYEAAD